MIYIDHQLKINLKLTISGIITSKMENVDDCRAPNYLLFG